jgi:cbb3-type cytochrome oxidase cytochrome c subunit
MKHDVVEKNVGLMIILTIVALSFGTLVEIVPLMFLKETNEPIAGLKPLPAIAGAKTAVDGKKEIDALVAYLQQLGTLLQSRR